MDGQLFIGLHHYALRTPDLAASLRFRNAIFKGLAGEIIELRGAVRFPRDLLAV